MKHHYQPPVKHKQRYKNAVKEVRRRSKKLLSTTVFHTDVALNKKMRKRAQQMLGAGPYSGEKYAGDLRFRLHGMDVLPDTLVDLYKRLPESVVHIYFVTICTNKGQIPRDMRYHDFHAQKVQVSNIVATHLTRDSDVAEFFGVFETVEVRGELPGYDGPVFDMHVHGVFATDKELPPVKVTNERAKGIQHPGMPGKSIH